MTTTQNINDMEWNINGMECPQYMKAHCVHCGETDILDMWASDYNAWAEWHLVHSYYCS